MGPSRLFWSGQLVVISVECWPPTVRPGAEHRDMCHGPAPWQTVLHCRTLVLGPYLLAEGGCLSFGPAHWGVLPLDQLLRPQQHLSQSTGRGALRTSVNWRGEGRSGK